MNATLARLTRHAAEFICESDGRLIDAFLNGSPAAFRELVTRHGPLVYGVCQRVLRHRQDAEDAMQAVFLVLARRAADVWPRDALASWLYGVAYRVSLKARTIRDRRRTREQPLDDIAAPAPDPLEPDTAEAIHHAIRRLPERYRAAVVACDLEGLSRAEAATRLGWKEGTLSGRLARARQLLAVRLRNAGLSMPAAGLSVTLGTTTPVNAALTESIIRLVSDPSVTAVPASVAALTEGVVTSMFAFKVKAVIAAFALVCGLGYGAWAAGSGDGPGAGMGGAGAQPAPSGKAAIPEAGQPNPTRGPRIELARQELQILGVTLKATGKGKVDPEMLERILAELNAIEGLLDPDSVNGVKVPPERNSDASNPTRARWIGDPGTVEKFDSTDAELQLLLGDLASKLHNAKIDPMYAEQLRDRVEMARWMLRESRKAAGVDNPSDPVARAELDLYRAKMQMLRAQAESERSQTAAAVAQASYEKAKAEVEAAKRKRARDAKEPPAANDPAFTIHLRTQLDAEKVIRVKATGNETVLDAISRVGEVLPIKAGGVRVWLVRDGKVLPVERAAILQGQTATNYILQPGDKLFVQSGTGK